jgi:hypothetical protein
VVLLALNFVQILNCILIQTLFKFQNLFIYKICLNSTFCSHVKKCSNSFFVHMHNLFKLKKIKFENCSNLFKFEICSYSNFVQIRN